MATASSFGLSRSGHEPVMHVYTLCFFRRGEVVPAVEIVEALDDTDAILIAQTKGPSFMREIWDRHRLVARLVRRA